MEWRLLVEDCNPNITKPESKSLHKKVRFFTFKKIIEKNELIAIEKMILVLQLNRKNWHLNIKVHFAKVQKGPHAKSDSLCMS